MARKGFAQTKSSGMCVTPQSRDGICRRIDLSLRRLSSSIQTVTVGFGVAPNLPCGSWAITTGRELHPALKSFDSIVWWSFSNFHLQVLKTIPAKTAKRKAPNTRFRARRRHAKTLAQQKTPERTHSRAVIQHARGYTPPCAFSLLSSRLYCRLRNRTESCLAARGLYHR